MPREVCEEDGSSTQQYYIAICMEEQEGKERKSLRSNKQTIARTLCVRTMLSNGTRR